MAIVALTRLEQMRRYPEDCAEIRNYFAFPRGLRASNDVVYPIAKLHYNFSSSTFNMSTALRMRVSSSSSAHCAIHSLHCFNKASFWRRKWVRMTSSKPSKRKSQSLSVLNFRRFHGKETNFGTDQALVLAAVQQWRVVSCRVWYLRYTPYTEPDNRKYITSDD